MSESSDDRYIAHADDVAVRFDLMDRTVVEAMAADGDKAAQAWLEAN